MQALLGLPLQRVQVVPLAWQLHLQVAPLPMMRHLLMLGRIGLGVGGSLDCESSVGVPRQAPSNRFRPPQPGGRRGVGSQPR